MRIDLQNSVPSGNITFGRIVWAKVAEDIALEGKVYSIY
jgi:hypothetical protein